MKSLILTMKTDSLSYSVAPVSLLSVNSELCCIVDVIILSHDYFTGWIKL